MTGYFGTQKQQQLQARAEAGAAFASATPGACQVGRFMGCDDPDRLGRGMVDVTPQYAEHDADGLYRYLVDVGAVIDDLPPVVPAEPVVGDVDAAELIATSEPGVLVYLVEIGEWVTEGQRLVLVLTEAGSTPHEVIAPFDGLVMTRLDKRFARRGEHVIKVLRHPRPQLDA
jgi:uncharacterized protein